MEGARRGILPGATSENCQTSAEGVLDIVGVQGYDVTIEPSTITDDTEFVTVTVEIDLLSNALPMSQFILGNTYHREITLQRERQ